MFHTQMSHLLYPQGFLFLFLFLGFYFLNTCIRSIGGDATFHCMSFKRDYGTLRKADQDLTAIFGTSILRPNVCLGEGYLEPRGVVSALICCFFPVISSLTHLDHSPCQMF